MAETPTQKNSSDTFDTDILNTVIEQLREQARGNGVDETSITIETVDAKTHTINAKMVFDFTPETEEKTLKGEIKNVTQIEDGTDPLVTYKNDIKDAIALEDLDQDIRNFLAEKTSNGFGQDTIKIPIAGLDKTYAMTRICKSCTGDGDVTCGACQGEGRSPCSKCFGSAKVQCYECNGIGQKENRIQKTKTETNAEGETVQTTEVEVVTEPCANCGATGQVDCGFCNKTGTSACNECGGAKKVKCTPCDATGKITIQTQMTGMANGTFILETDNLDPKIKTLIEKTGIQKLGDAGHLKADILPESKTSEEKSTKTIFYEAQLPYADIKIHFGDITQNAKLIGYNGKMSGIKPFLDSVVKQHLNQIGSGIRGKTSLMKSLKKSLELRLFREGLELVSQHRRAKAAHILRQSYPTTLSNGACQAIVNGLRASLQNLSKSAKWYGLAAGLVGNILLIGFYTFLAWGESAALRSGFMGIVDIVILLIGVGLNTFLTKYISNKTVVRMFSKSKLSTENVKVPLEIDSYAIATGSGILIYILALVMSKHPPLWGLKILGLFGF